jgi:hypothetical protein
MVRTETRDETQPRGVRAVRRALRGAAIASIALAWAAAGASAADDPLLKRLVGEWEGLGTVRWDAGSDPERVYCKITAALTADGLLRQSGRCALATDSAAISIDIRAGNAGSYSGVATGALGFGIVARKSSSFTGTGKGNQLVLTTPPGDDRTGPTTTIIDLLNRGFRVRAELIDASTGKKYTASDVTFGPPSS